ncbi:hypothetical protein, partial [Mangrovimonas sp. TPBH4]|uniref:hypothetical protein n=1 Tax=Mangrovimonas sp. TPBH4 TaxID=1645914 RepID=UPI000B020473
KKGLSFLFVICCSTFLFAQKAKVLEGDWAELKGISNYDLVFEYENLEIPNYDSEEEFLKDKMKKREEKEAGAGEKFKASWFADRENKYEPKFIESFNKRFDEGEVKVGMEDASEYVMKIKTTFMYSGYNVGIKAQKSKVDAIISVYKKDAPDEVLFSVKYTKAEGTPVYNAGDRIAEAYAKLAKTLAKTMIKKSA